MSRRVADHVTLNIPLPDDIQRRFMEAAIGRCGEILQLGSYSVSKKIEKLRVTCGATPDEICANPERVGLLLGAGIAGRIVNQLDASDADPVERQREKVSCPRCPQKVWPSQFGKCQICGADLNLGMRMLQPKTRRQRLVHALFVSATARDAGLGLREIDRQEAQAVLEDLGLANDIAIIDLGTAVRAPSSDLDFCLGVTHNDISGIPFPKILSALQNKGIEANPGSHQNELRNIDELIEQYKSGAQASKNASYWLKAEHLAGSERVHHKLKELKKTIIRQPFYKQGAAEELLESGKDTSRCGPFGPSFWLKGAFGGIRDIQRMAWLSAFIEQKPPGDEEDFNGLVNEGYITATEARILDEALQFMRNIRRVQHMVSGRESDDFAPATMSNDLASFGLPDIPAVIEKGKTLVNGVRAIVKKVQARLV